MNYFIEILGKILPSIGITFTLAFSSMILGCIFGALLTAAKLSNNKTALGFANGFTTIVRSTPTVILLFLVYYGLPMLIALTGIDISGWNAIIFSILALTIYASAVLSEIFRPAYISINKGQAEAGACVGLSKWQTLIHIIFPQTIYVALPNMGNMILSLIQESALAYLIGVMDIMGKAKVINSMSFGAHIITIYTAVSLVYWILSIITGRIVDGITASMGRYLR